MIYLVAYMVMVSGCGWHAAGAVGDRTRQRRSFALVVAIWLLMLGLAMLFRSAGEDLTFDVEEAGLWAASILAGLAFAGFMVGWWSRGWAEHSRLWLAVALWAVFAGVVATFVGPLLLLVLRG